MKVVCIADLQGMCWDVMPSMIPKGDILLIAGDLAGWGNEEELIEFNDWVGHIKKANKYKHIIVIGGNHDIHLEHCDGKKLLSNCTYIQDELIEVEGLRIYGTPASEMNELRFNYNWAFCEPFYMRQVAESIPDKLDILLAHGPVYGILDKTTTGKTVGSRDLRQAVIEKKPKYYVCGHIHESHGQVEFNGTTYINAALCNERNQMFLNGELYYKPIVIDL